MKISHRYHSWIVPAAVVGILCLFILARTVKQNSQWWKFLASGEIYQALTHADNIIYVGDANGLFYAIDDKTGKELWHYTTDHAVSSQAVIFGDEIIFSTEDGTLFALETKTGTEFLKTTVY